MSTHPLCLALNRKIDNLKSLDHLIRPRERFRRNRQADLLRRFQIDNELELRRLFDWQVSRLCALEDFVDTNCSTSVNFGPRSLYRTRIRLPLLHRLAT
jgi:hypothetical protein